MPHVKKVLLKEIRKDGGTQMRAQIDMAVAEDYAEKIRRGVKFPSVIIFSDGTNKWLADGFHRYEGHELAGQKSINAEVKTGTLRDAILYAVGANENHGLRRSNSDKQKAVETLLADEEWSKKSNRWIAEKCLVDESTVRRYRNEMASAGASQPDEREGKDGKTRPASNSSVASTPANTPAPPDGNYARDNAHNDDIGDDESEDDDVENDVESNGEDNSTADQPTQVQPLTTKERIEAIPLYQALAAHPHSGRIFFDQAEVWIENAKMLHAVHAASSKLRFSSGPVADAIKTLAAIPAPEKWEGCGSCKGTLRIGERKDPCHCKGGFTVHISEGVTADVIAAHAPDASN